MKLLIFLIVVNVAYVTFSLSALKRKVHILEIFIIDFEDKLNEISESNLEAKELMDKVREINEDMIKELQSLKEH